MNTHIKIAVLFFACQVSILQSADPETAFKKAVKQFTQAVYNLAVRLEGPGTRDPDTEFIHHPDNSNPHIAQHAANYAQYSSNIHMSHHCFNMAAEIYKDLRLKERIKINQTKATDLDTSIRMETDMYKAAFPQRPDESLVDFLRRQRTYMSVAIPKLAADNDAQYARHRASLLLPTSRALESVRATKPLVAPFDPMRKYS